MPRNKITWQQRGEYLAQCFGMTSKAFGAGIDAAMARGVPQGGAAKPGAGARAAAGKTSTARKAAAKQPAGATSGE